MTRRLTITILLTVWAMLIAGGVVAYAVTRAVLLDYFDQSLLAYAASVPGLVHDAGSAPALSPIGGDRFLVRDDLNRTVARAGNDRELEPKLVSATFSYAQGERLRTVEVKAFADNRKPVTVIYTRSAVAFDERMDHLAVAFAIFGAVAGLLTAAVAWWVSRAALRPLKQTVRQIQAIDERRLDSRVDATALPPEMRPMAQQLNDLLARLEAAFAARQRFLADASHELRTPLAAVIMTMEVSLRHPRDAAAYRATIENCLSDANQLRRLVERMMEQVRSQNLSHDEPAVEIDLPELLNQIVRTMHPLAVARGLELQSNIPSGVKCVTLPGRLRSGVTNLLSNAIEYNKPNGKVELACVVDADRGQIAIRVSDTGIGIAPEHVEHVFEPFFRADKARNQEQGHLGLGLSLVKAHTQALGGTCTVQSTPGEGTTFTIEFAARVCAEAARDKNVTENSRSHRPLIEAS